MFEEINGAWFYFGSDGSIEGPFLSHNEALREVLKLDHFVPISIYKREA